MFCICCRVYYSYGFLVYFVTFARFSYVLILGYPECEQDSEKRSKTIQEIGCVQAGEEWIERNLIVLASFAILLAFMEVLFVCVFRFFVVASVVCFFK